MLKHTYKYDDKLELLRSFINLEDLKSNACKICCGTYLHSRGERGCVFALQISLLRTRILTNVSQGQTIDTTNVRHTDWQTQQ